MLLSIVATPCIFCDGDSGSEEHLWPAWMHRRVKFGPVRVQLGSDPEFIADDPERTINTVCHTCNNTWMSELEQKNVPALSGMLEDKPTSIDVGRQRLLTEWAVKTAMVADSVNKRQAGDKFYTKDERAAMRVSRAIPQGTRIWIGGLTESHLGAFGTDFTILNGSRWRIGRGIANTIVAGHFVVQVVTIHPEVNEASDSTLEVQPKPGNWKETLIQLHPKVHKAVSWPPPVKFTNGGSLSAAFLTQRWRGGEKVSKITDGGSVKMRND